MIVALTLVIYGSLLTVALAGGWLMWNGLDTDSRVDSMRRGTVMRAEARGEAQFGAHPIFDVEVTR